MWFQMKKGKQTLRRDGYYYSNTKTEIYEANIPPILRFFHIHDISPSGWIGFQSKRVKQVRGGLKTTTIYIRIRNRVKIYRSSQRERDHRAV